MKKKKYPIKKEFFPYTVFSAPLNRLFLRFARTFMKPPRRFFHDPAIETKTIAFKGKEGEPFSLYLLSPKNEQGSLPCLYFVHGGGFIYPGTTSHYWMAMEYVKRLHVRLVYLEYGLAPEYPFPYSQEQSYQATQYLFDHAEELGIDPSRIGMVGDSAGATLCVSSILLGEERQTPIHPAFCILLYPWLDGRGNSESSKRFVDTPLWNANKTKKAGTYTNPGKRSFPPSMVSACEIEDLSFMPPCYIEVAEFDALHDDGVLFASRLKECGVEARLYETLGAMHGYDCKYKAPTVVEAFARRLDYVKEKFGL